MNHDHIPGQSSRTRERLLAKARNLEQKGRGDDARKLLSNALQQGDDTLVRIELGRQLFDDGQLEAARQTLDNISKDGVHSGAAHLLRAAIAAARRRPNKARLHLDDARRSNVPTATVKAWRSHIFDGTARPPLLGIDETSDDDTTRELIDEKPPPEDEPTHLITYDKQAFPEEPEPTHRINLDADLDDANDGKDDEPTHLITFDDEPKDDVEAAAIDGGDDESCPELPGIQRSAAAVFGFDDHTPNPDLEESIELEIDESALRGGIRVADTSREDEDQSALRRFTAVVRDRAQSRIVETLQSPGRALLLALGASSVVLVVGFLSIYAALAHAHLDRQLDGVERAIGADLYSSHLAALRDLRQIPEHRTLPVGPVDTVVGAIVDSTPLLSPAKKRERAQHLERYVEARLDYRFAAPATYLDADVELDRQDSELLAAADVYRRLSRGDHFSAVQTAQNSFSAGADEDLAILAYTDALAEAGTPDTLRLVADTAPRDSAAQAFSAARILFALERDDDASDVLRPLIQGDIAHPGAQIALARYDADPDAASELVSTLDDPNHPHISPRERALARVTASLIGDDLSARREHLRRAVDLAPEDPEAIAPFVDFLLEGGELREARRLLATIPSSHFPPPHFDVVAARLDLLERKSENAEARLEPHAFDHLEATAMLGVLRLRGGELSDARALFDAVGERNPVLGDILTALLLAHRADFDDAAEHLGRIDAPNLSPFFQAIHIEALRLTAGLANDRSRAEELVDDALQLADDAADAPEVRRQACLAALDRRDRDASRAQCSPLIDTDVEIRHNLDAAARFLHYQGEPEKIRALLDDHLQESGSHPAVALLRSRLHIKAGELESARQALDDVASRLHDSPDYLIAEGKLAIARGRLQRAERHFRRAEEASPLFRPAARLGRLQIAGLHRDTSQNSDELVESVHPLLRHGEYGPRAWAAFAAIRRLQDRLSDASENLAIARRARADYGPDDELLDILLEEATLTAHRRGPGSRHLEPLLDELADLAAHHWRYHLLAARWHRRQRRSSTDRVEYHLAKALRIAPDHCPIWHEKDDAGASTDTGAQRPEEC